MSIERIKELNESIKRGDIVGEQWEPTKEVLLCLMADLMLEEHEQKEKTTKNISTNDLRSRLMKMYEESFKDVKEQIGVNDAILGNTVEVGQISNHPSFGLNQIWRNKESGGCGKIIGFDSLGDPYISFGGDMAGNIPDFINTYELVTMENIKENEWVYDTVNNYKTRVESVDKEDVCKINIGYGTYISENKFKYWKPCLPPMEEETKEPTKFVPKTQPSEQLKAQEYYREQYGAGQTQYNIMKVYTQEQLDKAVKEAREEYREEFEEEREEWSKRVAELINQNSTAYSEGFKEGKEDNEKNSDYWYGLGKKNGYSTAIGHLNKSLEATKEEFYIDS